MTEHQLFLFVAEVAVLFLAARAGGEIAMRIRLPMHVGEFAMGMILGPSLLGWVSAERFDALFPADQLQRSLLEVLFRPGSSSSS